MSWYSKDSVMKGAASDKVWWQTTYHLGQEVPKSGIYRCLGCGGEVCSNKGDRFPPQDHHHHSPQQSKIRWKLNVSSAPTVTEPEDAPASKDAPAKRAAPAEEGRCLFQRCVSS